MQINCVFTQKIANVFSQKIFQVTGGSVCSFLPGGPRRFVQHLPKFVKITFEGIGEKNEDFVSELNEQERNDNLDEVVQLLPDVIKELKKVGLANIIIYFFRLVSNGKFPMQNISFLLWTEVVQWFNLENTSSMRYMEKTKKFWKLAMRHFGGKFIRFMTGFINTSDIVFQTARKEQCDPNNTDVNFAVPSEQILRNFNPYGLSGSKRYPGIYTDVMKVVSKALEQTSACLTFEKKKAMRF